VDPENHRKVKELFLEACNLEGADRSLFLDRACSGDGELRREVEELLAADETEGPATELGIQGEAPPLACPEFIDGYKIVRVIGRGGMGCVYEAEQSEPRRRVALKVFAAPLATPSLQKRFRAEVQVLARLNHRGIAQIFDAGTAVLGNVEQPYFVMELVDGLSLTDYVRSNRLGQRAIVQLFLGVCEALQHAHEAGVVHRDLKPANILVDRAGEPKVLDFGVAKVSQEQEWLTQAETRSGQFVGTLPYMSPEQVDTTERTLDARSDVYSLGLVLYELLIGQLPYDLGKKPLHEAARYIREGPVERPSLHDSSLRGDLETILLHCLEKDPERRYSSARDLQEDLQRFLRREPIRARPASVLYQVRTFTRRNRGLVVGTLFSFVLLLAASIVSLSLYFRSEEARQASDLHAAEAEQRFDLAREGADLLLQALCDELPYLLGGRNVQQNILELARQHYERLAAQAPDDLQQRQRIWLSFRHLGDAYLDAGNVGSAEQALQRCMEMVTEAVEAEPDHHEYRQDLALAYDRLGVLAMRRGDLDEAREMYSQARRQGELLVAAEPDELAYQMWYSVSEEQFAVMALHRGDLKAGRAGFENALHHQLALLDVFPGDPRVRTKVAVYLDELGRLDYREGDYKTSLDRITRSSEFMQGLWDEFPNNGFYINLLSINYEHLSVLAGEQGDLEKAREYAQKRHDLTELLVTSTPNHPQYLNSLAVSWDYLGDLARQRGNAESSWESYQRMLGICERLVRAEPANVLFRETLSYAHRSLGHLSSDRRDPVQARFHYEAARELAAGLVREEQENPSFRRLQGELTLALGELATQAGDDLAADDFLADSLRESRWLLEREPNDPQRGSIVPVFAALVRLAEARGQPAEARDWALEALELRHRYATVANAKLSDQLAYILLLLSIEPADLRDPLEALEEAEVANERTAGKDPEVLEVLARAYAANDDLEYALEALQKALALTDNPPKFRARIERRLAEYQELLDG
jgi:serine/threonine protein kinase/tetratricopeptide (TPR) repeat protein